jgi:outer membrane lipoprotein-sorting protein
LNKIFLIILIASFIFPLFVSCVPSKPIEEVELLPSERLINKLEANRRKIRNFEGVGIIEIESDQYDNSANFRVVMQKPDSIYFTILGPFGIELAQALVTTENYIFYDGLQNTAYTGEVNEDVLRNIFKVNLSFTDLLDAFVGSVNLTKNLYKQPNEYSIDYDKYVLTYIDANNNYRTTYRVDIRELGITDYSLKAEDGSIDIEGNYSNFELLESVAVPFVIEVNNKAENQKVKISYRNIIANDDDIFIDFILPDDATMISW